MSTSDELTRIEAERVVIRHIRAANEEDQKEPAGLGVDEALDPLLAHLPTRQGDAVVDALLHHLDELRPNVLASLLHGADETGGATAFRLTVHLLAHAMRRMEWYSEQGLGDLNPVDPAWAGCVNVITNVAIHPGCGDEAEMPWILGPLLVSDDRALRSAAWTLLDYIAMSYGPVPPIFQLLVTNGKSSADLTIAYHARQLARQAGW